MHIVNGLAVNADEFDQYFTNHDLLKRSNLYMQQKDEWRQE